MLHFTKSSTNLSHETLIYWFIHSNNWQLCNDCITVTDCVFVVEWHLSSKRVWACSFWRQGGTAETSDVELPPATRKNGPQPATSTILRYIIISSLIIENRSNNNRNITCCYHVNKLELNYVLNLVEEHGKKNFVKE